MVGNATSSSPTLIYFLVEELAMATIDLACYEDMRDIGVSEKDRDLIDTFASAFRSNRFIMFFSAVDEYVTASAFVLLARRSSIPPCDYHLWIIQAMLISWQMLEESPDLTYSIENAFGIDRSDELHEQAYSLAANTGWNTHVSVEEINGVLSQMRFISKDILRTRVAIPLL